ncbi:MAG: hypothetical protein ACO1TE_11750, partial [Prosthecobacter sp.]
SRIEAVEALLDRNASTSVPDLVSKVCMVCAINCVLAGRTELNFATWWRLRFFFMLVWLQKRLALAKPIEIG